MFNHLPVSDGVVAGVTNPEVPYPPETLARGWRFEIDHEQIERSDTWALAPAEVRPWLLMLWMKAWMESPCGSLPNNDAVIAAKIGIQPKLFAKHRDVLLRGWWAASDGRIYHSTITARVLQMLAARSKDRARTESYRARAAGLRDSNDGVTRDTCVTPDGVHPVQHVSSTPVPVPEEEQDQKISSLREEGKTRVASSSPDDPLFDLQPAPAKQDRTPFADVVNLYHEKLPKHPHVAKVTPNRASHIKARWRDELPTLEDWAAYFERVASSRFLTGRTESRDRPPFLADFDWLIRQSNCVKVAEGKYHREGP